ncbi:MAG TPA: glutathione S-transferase [Cyanothece sp. UBA12306]|nr:glutathione S-transferase [Cyanothece sp. UBA12306]
MSNQATIPTWEKLLEISQPQTTVKWEIRANQSPSTVALSSYLDQVREGKNPPVVLYRDTNAWCPFCERVWFALEEKQIPFAVELINLGDKPKWYTDLVPTGLVPAVKIEGELVYESKEILLRLEEQFKQYPLLPEDPQEKAVALDMIETCENGGFSRLAYQFTMNKIWGQSDAKQSEKEQLSDLKNKFEAKLDDLEKALAQYPGDYLMKDFSLVDIMYINSIKRLSANLPVFRGYHIRGNEKYPLLNRWLKAINQRPAYQRVKSDDRTNNLVMKHIFKLKPISNDLNLIPDYNASDSQQDRLEAAAKLSDNYQTVIKDIMNNSGIKTWVNQDSLTQIEEYIDLSLRLLAQHLINGHSLSLEDNQMIKNNEGVAIGTIALSYIRNRVCVPRDMTAGAAHQFRCAADEILRSFYSVSF